MKLTITLDAPGVLKKPLFATSTACLFGSYDCRTYGPAPGVVFPAIHWLILPFCTPPWALTTFGLTIEAAGCAQSCKTFASGCVSVMTTVWGFGVAIDLISGGGP